MNLNLEATIRLPYGDDPRPYLLVTVYVVGQPYEGGKSSTIIDEHKIMMFYPDQTEEIAGQMLFVLRQAYTGMGHSVTLDYDKSGLAELRNSDAAKYVKDFG